MAPSGYAVTAIQRGQLGQRIRGYEFEHVVIGKVSHNQFQPSR
jgi:hypothetical protein